jgi:hypothetical protein
VNGFPILSRVNSLKDKVHVLVAIKGGHDDGGSDDEEDAAKEHHQTLGDVPLMVVHLDADLQGGDDDHDACHRIEYLDGINHHGTDEGRGLGKAVGSPGVVYRSATGMGGSEDAEHGGQNHIPPAIGVNTACIHLFCQYSRILHCFV